MSLFINYNAAAVATLALSTMCGVVLHDSHIDSATISAMSVNSSAKSSTDAPSAHLHTHAEHVQIHQAASSNDPRDNVKHKGGKHNNLRLQNDGDSSIKEPRA